MLIDGVVNMSAIFDFFFPFCPHDHLTRSKIFINDRAIYWACAGKKYGFSVCLCLHLHRTMLVAFNQVNIGPLKCVWSSMAYVLHNDSLVVTN